MTKSSDLFLSAALFDEIFNSVSIPQASNALDAYASELDEPEELDEYPIETMFLQMISQGTSHGILDIADLTLPASVIQDFDVRSELHASYGKALLKNPALRFYVKAVKDSVPLFVEGDQLIVHFPSDAYIIKVVSKLGGYPFEDSSPMAEILNTAYDRAILDSGRRLVTMKDLGLGKAEGERKFQSVGKPSKANGLVFDPNGEIFNQESFTTAPKTQFSILDLSDEEICDRLFNAKKRASKEEIVKALLNKNFSKSRIETIYSLYRDQRDSEDLSSGVR